MSIIALFAVVLVSLSAHTERAFEAAEGFHAPDFTVTHTFADSSAVALADMKGTYTLVNFWSSEQPQSRIAANEYNRVTLSLPAGSLSLLSVNLDSSAALHREVVSRDRLTPEMQFHVEASKAERLVDAYNMRHGLRSFLIDPQGTVIAVNPTKEAIISALNR